MGQKVNPIGLRLGINKGWDSVWYANKKNFGNYLIEDFKIREHIKKTVVNSGVSKVMIERTTKKCFVTMLDVFSLTKRVVFSERLKTDFILASSSFGENGFTT